MKIISTNKKANFEYYIEDKIEAGIELKGSEVKSARQGHFSLIDSYATIKNGEIFLINAYIKTYDNDTLKPYEERRARKLLLHKNEINKLIKKKEEKGYTLIPLKAYFKNNHIKIEIGVGKGKKIYDKRKTIKERELNRATNRELKNNY